MKVLYINIYEGGEDRIDRIIKFVNKIKPDVLGLSELNSWQDDDYKILKEFKKNVGLKEHIFVKASSGYNLAIFTKQKISSQKSISKGFKTGLIIAEINHVQFILTHLHSGNEDLRLRELDIIDREKKHMPTILMGDLNALSPKDTYPDNLMKTLQDLKITKFGENNLRREVITRLEAEYIDAVRLFSKEFEYSVPTPFNKDYKHADKLRLDYLFTTQGIKPKLAKIIRNKETDNLSDHYPILLEF